MDDFAGPETLDIDAIAAWLDDGGHFSQLDIRAFCAALADLKAGRAAFAARHARAIRPAPVILAEAPMGRAHSASAALIDTLVWIDLPLDVALARNLLALGRQPDAQAHWFETYLEDYLRTTRLILMHQQKVVRPCADIILDGTQSPLALWSHLRQEMGR
jgi:uridine kinase